MIYCEFSTLVVDFFLYVYNASYNVLANKFESNYTLLIYLKDF